ncbi:MAG: DUF3879 family protein [bacterium]
MTITQMARMKLWNENYNLNNSSKKTSSNNSSEMEEVYIQKGKAYAEAHMDELRASGYLATDNSHKVIIPISDEVKNEVEEYVKNLYVNQQGWYIGGQQSVGDISYAYTQTLEPNERLSAGWSVNQYYFEVCDKYKAVVNETNPNWPYDGSTYDPSIFDNFTAKSVDYSL